MPECPAIDSRDYILSFELRSATDCPPDFELPSSATRFDAGLFLPRRDRSDAPRVLLLAAGALHIVPHPSAGEPARQCAIEQIVSVEAGHMLLKGWLRFTAPAFDCAIRYNTRGLPPVLKFMQHFRTQLLGAPLPDASPPGEVALDLKFANGLASELDEGETVRAHVFQPPTEVRPKRWRAGDLLALTARRLLWITDRERGFCSRYGTVVSYAPIRAVESITPTSDRGADVLRIALAGGSTWRIPIAHGANFITASIRSGANLI